MRKVLSWFALITVTAVPALRAQEPPPTTTRTTTTGTRTRPQASAPVIGTRHIDRYDAITALQQRVKENPSSLADWIILGELSHEVALDLPADQAARYYRISREAYEKALALKPDQPGLKAAVQFAMEHEANSQRFEEVRDRATNAYLEARRRDLAATQYMPSLPVYGVPVRPVTVATPGTPVAPATTSAAVAPPPGQNNLAAPAAPPAAPVLPPSSATQAPERAAAAAIVKADPDPAITNAPAAQDDAANMGTQQFYSNALPSYQTYYARGVPYTYEQYRSSYDPYGTLGSSATPPITVQRYYQQAPAAQQLPAYPGRQSGNPFR